MSRDRVACLIAYDIADPKRLRRVHALLKGRALPLQYSVFLGRFTGKELDDLEQELRRRIHPKQDDVRIYALPGLTQPVSIGRPVLPAGVSWAAPDAILLAAEDEEETEPA